MPRSKNGQLTQGDRMAIEQQLKDCRPLPEIARGLGVAPSTVAREIKRNGVSSSPSFLSVETRNICLRREACSKRDVCGKGCLMPCPTCRTSMCNKVCPDFLPDQCPWLAKPPFACNGCHRRYGMGCGYEYRFYDGRMAHELAQKRKVESREGIDVMPEELEAMRSIVRPLIKKGQSPEVIWATRAGELPVSLSTFYRYVEMGRSATSSGWTCQRKCDSSQGGDAPTRPRFPGMAWRGAHTRTSRPFRMTKRWTPSKWIAW